MSLHRHKSRTTNKRVFNDLRKVVDCHKVIIGNARALSDGADTKMYVRMSQIVAKYAAICGTDVVEICGDFKVRL